LKISLTLCLCCNVTAFNPDDDDNDDDDAVFPHLNFLGTPLTHWNMEILIVLQLSKRYSYRASLIIEKDQNFYDVKSEY
jgi:hypothetical protein